MKLSHLKNILNTINSVNFQLEDGELVPKHFHITEIGIILKQFIDCGGIVRDEKVVNIQLWNANDINHRLKPNKLIKIIELVEKQLSISDLPIEVEYQKETIGKYDLLFNGENFVLMSKTTKCLAKDSCETTQEKPKVSISGLDNNTSCTPESGCC
jgi:hypothetical protein